MSKTHTSTIRVLALFGLIATLGTSAAMAQSTYNFQVPFRFTAGSKSFAAGDYYVAEAAHNVIVLRNNAGRHDGVIVGASSGERGKAVSKATLTFHRYGGLYFLSSVENYNRGWKLPMLRAEREFIAGKVSPEALQILASSGK